MTGGAGRQAQHPKDRTQEPGLQDLDQTAGSPGHLLLKVGGMHDVVIGLLINKVEFGRDIHA